MTSASKMENILASEKAVQVRVLQFSRAQYVSRGFVETPSVCMRYIRVIYIHI